MNIKLFVSDLDGTLLDHQYRLSEENKEAVMAAVDEGVLVTLATGRMYRSALPYAQQLGVDLPIITYNGALVKTVSGKELYHSFFEPETVKALLRYCFSRQWYIHLYQGDGLYFKEYCRKAQGYEALAGIRGEVVGEDGLYERCHRVLKMVIITGSGDESDAVVARLRQDFPGQLSPVKSNPEYVEIINPGISKATALKFLLEQLDLKEEQVMAIGDSDNDLEMLQTAGVSVAMGNAGQNVRDICDFVTTDCTESGVAKAIYDYVLKG